MKIGSEGLKRLDLVIPQKCTFIFDVVHKTTGGSIVDHSGSEIHMVIEDKKRSFDLSQYCVGTVDKIVVSIPYSETAKLPIGEFVWDLIAIKNGDATRILYGDVEVVDTYALDEEI